MAASVMIMAGGTGGHVFPALAVANWLKQAGHTVTWLGTQKGIEAKLVPAAGIDIDWLSVKGLRGKGLLSKILAPIMLIKACWQAARIIKKRQPDVVLGLGGFASGPGGLMAFLMRKPLVIHEQNRVPGTTNRLLRYLASTVLEAFPKSFGEQVGAIFTGNPIRQEMLEIAESGTGKNQKAKNILIVGGSLGASILNETVPAALALMKDEVTLNVVHQAGKTTFDIAQAAYHKHQVKADVCVFIDDMKKAYQQADVVICRAGAMTISELTITAVPAILVPLPHAIDDHQTKNAQYLSESGAAILLKQHELTAKSLAKELKKILNDDELPQKMTKKLQKLAKPEATKLVAKACLELVV